MYSVYISGSTRPPLEPAHVAALCSTPSRPLPSRPVPSVLSCPVLACPVLSCPVLSCPVLSCLVLSVSLSVSLSVCLALSVNLSGCQSFCDHATHHTSRTLHCSRGPAKMCARAPGLVDHVVQRVRIYLAAPPPRPRGHFISVLECLLRRRAKVPIANCPVCLCVCVCACMRVCASVCVWSVSATRPPEHNQLALDLYFNVFAKM